MTLIISRRDEGARAYLDSVGHIFLCEEFDAWDWLRDEICPIFSGAITIGCRAKDVPRVKLIKAQPFAHRVRVVVRFFESDVMHYLGPDDEVSVGQPFDLTTFRVGDGIVTVPQDYEDDI